MRLHQGQPIATAGSPLESAKAAMILIHGRGASPHDILGLAEQFAQPQVAYLAPQAADYTWYPNRFIAPLASNEPYLTSALEAVETLVQQVEMAGIPKSKLVLLGFSQGACLALEYAARHAASYGAVVAFSGGLIGATLEPERYRPAFEQTPIFLGCSDVDSHIPLARVQASSALLSELGAQVTERIYPGMGHTINLDEIAWVKQRIAELLTI
jgi:predicted esterase